jgi:caffeoyl-CoA O-methyltransferase
MQNEVFGKVDAYICQLFAPEDDDLKAAAQSISASGMPQISVSASQGRLLQVLAKMCGAKKILELGTLAGYSTIWLARALPEYGRLISLEYDETYAAVARENIARAGLGKIVEIRTGAALGLLPALEAEGAGPFDMIFIDADKPPYAEYFQWALKLSRKGSVIVADNVIREGKVLDETSTDERVEGAQRFNKMLAACKEVTAVILQNVGVKEHDGMAIAVVN